MNHLDLAILIVLAFFAISGMRHGFLVGLVELAGIIVSIAIPFLLYIPLGRLLMISGVSPVYANPLAFLIIWFVTLNFYYFVVRRLYKLVPKAVRSSWANRLFGIIPGLIRGLVITAIVLTIITALPISLLNQQVVDSSRLAPPLIGAASLITGYAANIFGEAVQNFFGFLTIEPKTNERINLRFKVQNPQIDPQAEEDMLKLVNQERINNGLKPLVMDETLRRVARKHSIDMLRKGYFSHNSLDGLTPYDRMRKGGVKASFSGENLAFAPTVKVAHRGLMKSPGHRENILRPQFRRVGIGSAKGGRYGIMFTQDFSN